MDWRKKYQNWIDYENLDLQLQAELMKIHDEKKLEDMFCRYPEFGTGGMRGKMGPGTNRINRYTILRVATSLARYINNQGEKEKLRGVVISYDNRTNSRIFASLTACVLASYKVKVYLSDEMRPTPQLSFLVRELGAFAGVMITASHNPKEYNGFKVYGEDGGQITLETAEALMDILEDITEELDIQVANLKTYQEQEMVQLVSTEADELYLQKLQNVIQNHELIRAKGSLVSVVYTPLHGTGESLISKSFSQFGYQNLRIVTEQADGNHLFQTVKSPNPEDPDSFKIALDYAKKYHADLVMATDPDADRLGVVLPGKDNIFLNGNQIGLLLLDYLITCKKSQGEDLFQYFLCKTIVTSDLGAAIAKANGIVTRETLTGFKFIGEQIELSEKHKDKNFLFGYEESYGYLVSPFVRDKDAIQAAILFVELTLYWKTQRKTVLERLDEIYKIYGYYQESLTSLAFDEIDGANQMKNMLDAMRSQTIKYIGDMQVRTIEDYLSGTKKDLSTGETMLLDLPNSNVIKYTFDDSSWVCIRPSGTEPKCKIYYSVNDKTENLARYKLSRLKIDFEKLALNEELLSLK